MDSKEFKQRINRYLDGTASDTEKEAIDGWYESYRELEEAEIYKNDADAMRIKSAMQARLANHWAPAPKFRYRKYTAIAAAMLLFLGISLTIFHWQDLGGPNQLQPAQTVSRVAHREVSTAIRQVKRITLPDSSTVWMNAMSRLRIPQSFGNASRELYLEEGEAFFEVAPNAGKPFIVHSRGIVTKVLGTAFNIKNYRQLNTVAVTVEHGKVQLTDTTDKQIVAALVANQQLVYNRVTGAHGVSEEVSATAATWRDGATRLHDATFDDVALAMYNLYGVKLQTASDQIRSHRYTLVIRTTHHLDEALRILCSIHQHQYRREKNEVNIY